MWLFVPKDIRLVINMHNGVLYKVLPFRLLESFTHIILNSVNLKHFEISATSSQNKLIRMHRKQKKNEQAGL